MKINIADCNKEMSMLDFARENTATGNISLKLYGDKADNWINGRGRVPYIIIDGRMQWDVVIRDATIFDLVKTFCINIGNNLEIEFDEVQNWGSYVGDVKLQNTVFKKFLKSNVKQWVPKEKKLNIDALIDYITYTEIRLDFVFDAIWIRDSYSIEEFEMLFSANQKQADNILRCAGYEKKKCDSYYYLQYNRKQNILECIEKSFETVELKRNELNAWGNIKRNRFKRIEKIGDSIAEYGRRKNYYNVSNLSWNEPAYHKREGKLNVIFSFLLVFGMVLFVCVIVGVFSYQMGVKHHENFDSLYSFWGSIAGAMIAGLVTIFTTYLIIQRSYKIDFHQERIAILPFFEIKIISNHFSTESVEDIPFKVKEIVEKNTCYSTCLMDDAMLIEISNIGAGPAFHVEIEGLTASYEEPFFQSISVGNKKYVICFSRKEMNFIVKFCDIYSNFYYQRFNSENGTVWNLDHIEINTNPPEIVLRTKRTRYIQ